MFEKKNTIRSLFTVPIMLTNIGRNFTEDELQFFSTDVPINKNKGQGESNHRSKDFYLFDVFTEELKDIKKFCEYHLKQFLEEVEGIDMDIAGLRITQSWLNITKSQEHQHQHTHPNSYLSGVFYLKCLPNDRINFTNRLKGNYINLKFKQNKVTQWNAEGFIQEVKEGDLIIFPSWMPHYVDVNNSDKDRISLAFNTFPIGEMGDYYGSHLKL